MPDKYSLNFDQMVWQNMRRNIRNKGVSSVWYKILSVIFRFFNEKFLPILNHAYDQGFSETMDIKSLELGAKDYRIYKNIGESHSDFLNRYYSERLLLESDVSRKTIKSIFMILLGVDAEIVEGIDTGDIFKVGRTPLGVGKVYASDFFRFTFKVYLPDLSLMTFNRSRITRLVDEFSPNNSYYIYEWRDSGLYLWEES